MSRSLSRERRRERRSRWDSPDRRRPRSRSGSDESPHRRERRSLFRRREGGGQGRELSKGKEGRIQDDRIGTVPAESFPPRKELVRVFVGNFPFDTTEASVRKLFESCGKIESFTMPKRIPQPDDDDADDGGVPKSRGFAFLGFGSPDAAAKACMLTGSYCEITTAKTLSSPILTIDGQGRHSTLTLRKLGTSFFFFSRPGVSVASTLSGTEIGGRKIKVDIATDSKPTGGAGTRSSGQRFGQGQRSMGGDREAPPPKREVPAREFEWGKPAEEETKNGGHSGEPGGGPVVQEGPDFSVSGNLNKDERVVTEGLELKFEEPSDAKKPTVRWRLYVFKGGEALLKDDGGYYKIHRQSAYLFGRDRKVADIPTEHPSCSKQHAVLQYRKVNAQSAKPYLMDLDSVNGTFINGDRIEGRRYECKHKTRKRDTKGQKQNELAHDKIRDPRSKERQRVIINGEIQDRIYIYEQKGDRER